MREPLFEAMRLAFSDVEKLILETGLDCVTTEEFKTLMDIKDSIAKFQELISHKDISYETNRGRIKMEDLLNLDMSKWWET